MLAMWKPLNNRPINHWPESLARRFTYRHYCIIFAALVAVLKRKSETGCSSAQSGVAPAIMNVSFPQTFLPIALK